MNREQFKVENTAGPERKGATETLRLRNRMQYALAERHCIACSKPEFTDYILHEIGPAFGELVKRKPELLALYEKSPETALAAAEQEMHLERATVGRQ